jgi:hypothetical protein
MLAQSTPWSVLANGIEAAHQPVREIVPTSSALSARFLS